MATAALIAGTGLQAFSAIAEGQAQNKIATYNAAVSEQEGKAAVDKAEFDEALHRERVRKALSTQRTGVGASGVAVTGTAALATDIMDSHEVSIRETARGAAAGMTLGTLE